MKSTSPSFKLTFILYYNSNKIIKKGPNNKEYTYTSGWVDTRNKWSQHLGKFEANCSLPKTQAKGVWPAFWLMPQNGSCWPTSGEIDIFEMNVRLGCVAINRTTQCTSFVNTVHCGPSRVKFIPSSAFFHPHPLLYLLSFWLVFLACLFFF